MAALREALRDIDPHGRGVVTAAQLGRVLSNLGEGTLKQSYAEHEKQRCES